MGEELDAAAEACRKAGSILLEHFRKGGLEFSDKGQGNIVSEADLAAERAILDVIRSRFPEHSVYSEESGMSGTMDGNVWVVDPLDGTHNFSLGMPVFGISIALIRDGKPVLGVLYHPFLDMLLCAEEGKGAFVNGRKLVVRAGGNLDVVSVVAGYPSQRLQKAAMRKLEGNVKRILTQWAPSIDFMMLCLGKIDAILSLDSESEDQVAGILIAKEAGCAVRNQDGSEYTMDGFSEYLPRLVIARSEALCERMRTLVK